MKVSADYRDSFEKLCIKLLAKAYRHIIFKHKYQIDWDENDFSEVLCFYINEDNLSVKTGVTCVTEKKLLSEKEMYKKGFANKLARIDFIYFRIWKNIRFKYYMEAKRLKETDSTLKRAYINEGMQRFISKKYPLGCMVGYLLEGSIDKTIDGINSLLVKDKRDIEILTKKPHNDIHDYYESNHDVITILKHIILDFTLCT